MDVYSGMTISGWYSNIPRDLCHLGKQLQMHIMTCISSSALCFAQPCNCCQYLDFITQRCQVSADLKKEENCVTHPEEDQM